MFATATLEPDRVGVALTCVCCNCRRVRDRDTWVERPLAPGQRVTHGICPECVYELYPDIAQLICGR